MNPLSYKNLSLLSLVLMSASALAAAISDKSNGQRVKNGTLRLFSGTAAGADRDGGEVITTCIAIPGAMSCSATISNTTTGFFVNESRFLLEEFYYQTIGNTSKTASQPGNQDSVLQLIA